MRDDLFVDLNSSPDTSPDVALPEGVDSKLWFATDKGGERDYLEGRNPHTFLGRMAFYCPHSQQWGNVSALEIAECSLETYYWVSGYLVGNEPSPPNTVVVFPDEHPRYADWKNACAIFRRTGEWPTGAPNREDPDAVSDEGAAIASPNVEYVNVYPNGTARSATHGKSN
jgi:hypothetical protein